MNQNIKKLAEDAELTVGVWAVPDFILERFAKSIIERCIICAEREWLRNGTNSVHNQAVHSVIKSIKQHFGDSHE